MHFDHHQYASENKRYGLRCRLYSVKEPRGKQAELRGSGQKQQMGTQLAQDADEYFIDFPQTKKSTKSVL